MVRGQALFIGRVYFCTNGRYLVKEFDEKMGEVFQNLKFDSIPKNSEGKCVLKRGTQK